MDKMQNGDIPSKLRCIGLSHMRSFARHVIEKVLRRFEYRLADVEADPAGLEMACQRLRARGFIPRTVIDVGVGTGTPWLYRSFPESKFVLFEALDSFRGDVEKTTANLDAEVHFCALGEKPARMSIQVNTSHPTSSSMARYDRAYREVCEEGEQGPVFIDKGVEVRMLDEFLPFAGPALLKLDVEGFEESVLKGATVALRSVEIIISEVSIVKRTEMEPTLGGYVSLLESIGFSLMSIAEVAPMSRGGPLAYIDAVFVRSESSLRYR